MTFQRDWQTMVLTNGSNESLGKGKCWYQPGITCFVIFNFITKEQKLIDIGSITSESACWIIVCIAISRWTSRLEQLGIMGGLAGARTTILPAATELRLSECKARTFTGHNMTTPLHLEARWAGSNQVWHTTNGFTSMGTATVRHYRNWHIVAINKANVIKINWTILGKLCKWSRWLTPCPVTFKATSAVTCNAFSSARCI